MIAVVGEATIAKTQSDGSYALRLPPGSYKLRAARIGFAPVTHLIEVARGQPIVQDFSLSPSAVAIDPIVSIASRSGARTATESSVPVDVVTSDAMEATGFAETWEMVQRLVPSVNVTRVPLQDDQVRSINLRSLSPDHVLVLVNGKRRHNVAVVQAGPAIVGTSPVDINAIPPAAIERIEVLRDGAAAQHGSDAIAGVVNVILKSGKQTEAVASYGSTWSTEGGRDFRDGRYRSLSATFGRSARSGASLLATAQLRDRGPINRGYPDPRLQYFAGDPRNNNPPRILIKLGDAEASDAALQLVGSYPLRGAAELYATSGASVRNGLSTSSDFRPPMSDNTVRSIHPDGYLPLIDARILDFSTVMGVRGAAREWHWDLSSAVGSNSFRYTIGNTNNVSLGSASPTDFYVGTLRFAQWTNNLDVTRRVRLGNLIPVTVAAGAEFRRDAYRITAGEPDSWRDGGVRILDGPRAGQLAPVGSQGLVGYRPSDETSPARSNIAAYVDFEGKVTSALLAGVAARAERYSDFGATRDASATMRFEPARGIALRGSVGTGFRAPSLIQSYYSSTRVTRLVGAPDNGQVTVRVLPVASPEAQLLGARPLRPEESVNASAGVVFTLPHFPVVTADYYAVDIEGRILLAGSFLDSTIARMFAERGLRGVGGGSYFANAIDTRTRGLDVVATHGFLTGQSGTLRLTAAYNRTGTTITRVSSMPPELRAYQSSFFGRDDSARVEVAQPQSGGSVAAAWTGRRVSIDLHSRRFGRTTFVSETNPSLDQTFHGKWITDLSASMRIREKFRISATVGNMFDVYPDEWRDFSSGSAGIISFAGTVRYPAGHSPFGVNGRTVYIHLSYRD